MAVRTGAVAGTRSQSQPVNHEKRQEDVVTKTARQKLAELQAERDALLRKPIQPSAPPPMHVRSPSGNSFVPVLAPIPEHERLEPRDPILAEMTNLGPKLEDYLGAKRIVDEITGHADKISLLEGENERGPIYRKELKLKTMSVIRNKVYDLLIDDQHDDEFRRTVQNTMKFIEEYTENIGQDRFFNALEERVKKSSSAVTMALAMSVFALVDGTTGV